ncbi:MAG TPA: acetyl-CoA carboxylase biotin carboxyl carrier protein [Paracoccaceae bacterium]|nr:acetyl-CoA carboxylase biotin carboxyl carrier protein [Paracoccaceae bacterium]
MTRNPVTEDVEFIKALAEVLRSHDLSEIEVGREYGKDDSLTVRITRGGVAPVALPAPAPVAPAPQAISAQPAPASAPAPDPAEEAGMVTSPMVGTAYLQPEPGAPPFVKVGDTVTEGQTLLIIEAMKTMNQIPAPHAGTVKRILVEDAAPVEFGAPLMIIV